VIEFCCFFAVEVKTSSEFWRGCMALLNGIYVYISSYRICACISRTFDNLPSKIGCGLYTEFRNLILQEKAVYRRLSPWRRYCMLWNPQWRPLVADTIDYRSIPEVGRPWHHWQINVNAASDNQSAANAIANIILSHR
jgi:hypothetical protein